MAARTRSKRKRAPSRRTSVPAEMNAVVIDEFGPPSALETREMPVPRPGSGEVLIAVSAAGVGIWDAKIRDGSWAEGDMEFPLVLGVDGAGTIAEIGPGVRRFHVGDRVWAYQFESRRGGFYAEYVVVDADRVGTLPKGLTLRAAGAAAATGLTALQGIAEHLDLKRAETVMIFGASGAVGTLAVQFAARDRGARVIAIASGSRARAQLEKLGAETVIDGRRRNALERIEEAAPNGLDAILALASSPVLQKSVKREKRRTRGLSERRRTGAEASRRSAGHRLRRERESGGIRPTRPRRGEDEARRSDRREVSALSGCEGAQARGARPRRRTRRARDPLTLSERR
jgi:NADPH2:quinone reductase